ncbi:MAG: hypothetical protein JJT89_05760 [Nitriliruptoraceae bacterium]|nr:hypothetical protein [Nitriliruptoraceae bacterium]
MTGQLATDVWNRACTLFPGDDETPAREGDWALAGALILDGVVQNGGLGSAIEQEVVDAGVAGLRWLGLDEVAQVVQRAAQRVAAAEGADEDAAYERIEAEDDAAYYELDTAQRLTAALDARLATSPEAFAPVR